MFAVGNILNRAHNYFQDFWKRFSIFNKAQQLQLNRKSKTNQKKREGSTPGPYLCWPSHLARPSRLACQSSSTSRQEDAERVAGARGHTPATSCFCRRPGDVQGCHATPTSPSHPRSLSPRLPHPLPRWPSAILAAVRRSCHQSHPLASLTCP